MAETKEDIDSNIGKWEVSPYKDGYKAIWVGTRWLNCNVEIYYKDMNLYKFHRLDGPAIIKEGGNNEYWIDGVYLTKSQFEVLITKFKDKEELRKAVNLSQI